MKKILLIVVATLIYTINYAQSNLIVFTEDGEAFKMTVDGSLAQNLNESKAVYDGIKADFVQVKITFQKTVLGEIKKGFMIEPNKEITAIVKKNKKGAYVIRPMSIVDIEKALERNYIPAPVVEDISAPKKQDIVLNTGEITTTTTTIESQKISSETGTTNSGESLNMNVNINLNNIGVGVTQSVSGTTTTSTTTTTTTTNAINPTYTATEEMEEEFEVVCAPMSTNDFASAKKSIGSKSFAEDKMTLAKQVLRANCVSTDQVVEIMNLFNFEDNKVEFAKAAFDKTTDKGNYYKVNDAFTYSSSIKELNEYLEGK